MKTIIFLLQKEFRQIFRNKTLLPMIFGVPLIQMLVLVYAATFDMKNIDLVVLDKDHSSASRELVGKFDGIPFFNLRYSVSGIKDGEYLILTDEADAMLIIPSDMEHNMVREGEAKIQLIINAIDGNSAQLIYAYAAQIIADYNKDLVLEWKGLPDHSSPAGAEITENYWYNTYLDYKWYMAPGILAILVTIIGMFMSGMNLVREKETGTIEQLNVTPLKKHQFIIGKLVPFWIIALFDLAFGLFIAWLVFDLPIRGNLFVLFLLAGIYLISVLGLGLFISTVSETQQQVMFVSFFFMMIFILMGGIFTPVESMPAWAQMVDRLNPIYYFMKIMRNIILKGSGFWDLIHEFLALIILGSFFLTLAVWRYRKTT